MVGTTHEVATETVALNGLHYSVGMLRFALAMLVTGCPVILLNRLSDSCYILKAF